MTSRTAFSLPVGYYDFHKDSHINFELNRWYSLGYARFEDLQEVAPKIKDFDDWKREMIILAEQAENENYLVNAAFYYRAAEFFTSPDDPDKEQLYDKFIDLFYEVFKDEKIEKYSIPFENGYLPALRLVPETPRGVIIIHGGLDSFIEEFYSVAVTLVNAGYDVIMFEGPGQGAALRKHDLPMTYEWEKPVSAVLDHFNLEDVTLVGVSLGGYLALRAAAYEPRIARAVAYDVFTYDQVNKSGVISKLLYKLFLKTPWLYNRLVGTFMKRSLLVNWVVNQWLYVLKIDTPHEWIERLQHYAVVNIASLIKQDILLLAGAEDHMIQIKNYYKQEKAFTNARSVTGRIFTSDEHAQNHCQIGNIKLAIDVIMDWIEEKSAVKE